VELGPPRTGIVRRDARETTDPRREHFAGTGAIARDDRPSRPGAATLRCCLYTRQAWICTRRQAAIPAGGRTRAKRLRMGAATDSLRNEFRYCTLVIRLQYPVSRQPPVLDPLASRILLEQWIPMSCASMHPQLHSAATANMAVMSTCGGKPGEQMVSQCLVATSLGSRQVSSACPLWSLPLQLEDMWLRQTRGTLSETASAASRWRDAPQSVYWPGSWVNNRAWSPINVCAKLLVFHVNEFQFFSDRPSVAQGHGLC
jgi:hypothetical protein